MRRGGSTCVVAPAGREGEVWLKRATARAFHRVLNGLSGVSIPREASDGRLLSRRAVQSMNRLPERNRFTKGLFASVGSGQATIDCDRHPRAAGTTKRHRRRLREFAPEGITGFSVAPLELATRAGLLSALAAFVYARVVAFGTFVFGEPVAGFPTLGVTIPLLGGLQLTSIGIVGNG